ncbi:MAG: hypothetical protein JXA52_02030 [Planctomycetes bacterium]|nr:hypothetical protein [Planctomycetota bacterium]
MEAKTTIEAGGLDFKVISFDDSAVVDKIRKQAIKSVKGLHNNQQELGLKEITFSGGSNTKITQCYFSALRSWKNFGNACFDKGKKGDEVALYGIVLLANNISMEFISNSKEPASLLLFLEGVFLGKLQWENYPSKEGEPFWKTWFKMNAIKSWHIIDNKNNEFGKIECPIIVKCQKGLWLEGNNGSKWHLGLTGRGTFLDSWKILLRVLILPLVLLFPAKFAVENNDYVISRQKGTDQITDEYTERLLFIINVIFRMVWFSSDFDSED